jgi:hypothetical protein
VLPSTLGVTELARRLAAADAVAVKLRDSYPPVREALSVASQRGDAVYKARAAPPGSGCCPPPMLTVAADVVLAI